jgi:hypothetical protein
MTFVLALWFPLPFTLLLLANSTTLIVAVVHINEYMSAYIDSNQTDILMLAYGLTYTVDGIATAYCK